MRTLVANIGSLVTLEPLARAGRFTGIGPGDLGQLDGAWLAVEHGKVLALGTGTPPEQYKMYDRVDAGGGLVMPGLVDSHTHALYAGSRAGEFAARLGGATYQEIAAQGGGIQSTRAATRRATDRELETLLDERLSRLLALGITTVEVKTGYGLSVPEELRQLRLLKAYKSRAKQHLEITCLALHAASPEHASLKAYVQACVRELLPVVAAEGLAQWVDAFVESGYFSVDDVEPYAAKARELGLGVRLHADEFSDAGAAAAAADWGAASADHLQFASDRGVKRMAERGVVATLLPGTSLYTRLPFTSGRRFADAGVPVAVATDFNPGSCRLDNLAMLAAVAAVQAGLTPAEAIAAVTWVAAKALGLHSSKGALAPGFDADFLVYDLTHPNEWLADFGRTPPRAVFIRGALTCSGPR